MKLSTSNDTLDQNNSLCSERSHFDIFNMNIFTVAKIILLKY